MRYREGMYLTSAIQGGYLTSALQEGRFDKCYGKGIRGMSFAGASI